MDEREPGNAEEAEDRRNLYRESLPLWSSAWCCSATWLFVAMPLIASI